MDLLLEFVLCNHKIFHLWAEMIYSETVFVWSDFDDG